MIKRRSPEGPPIPERLARFQRSEWPRSLSCAEAVQAWHEARERWAAANAWIDDSDGWVTSPLGDSIDRLRAKREARLRACHGVPGV